MIRPKAKSDQPIENLLGPVGELSPGAPKRPKLSLRSLLRKALNKYRNEREAKVGRRKADVLMDMIVDAALREDEKFPTRLYQLLLETVDGKPTQTIMTNPDERDGLNKLGDDELLALIPGVHLATPEEVIALAKIAKTKERERLRGGSKKSQGKVYAKKTRKPKKPRKKAKAKPADPDRDLSEVG